MIALFCLDSARFRLNPRTVMPSLKGLLSAVSVVLLALSLGSCGEKDTHDKVMRDTHDLMAQLATVLESVEDEESGKAAAAKLDVLVARFEEIAARNEAIGPPDASTIEVLNEEFEERRAKIRERFEALKLKTLADQPALKEAFDKLGAEFEKLR